MSNVISGKFLSNVISGKFSIVCNIKKIWERVKWALLCVEKLSSFHKFRGWVEEGGADLEVLGSVRNTSVLDKSSNL